MNYLCTHLNQSTLANRTFPVDTGNGIEHRPARVFGLNSSAYSRIQAELDQRYNKSTRDNILRAISDHDVAVFGLTELSEPNPDLHTQRTRSLSLIREYLGTVKHPPCLPLTVERLFELAAPPH